MATKTVEQQLNEILRKEMFKVGKAAKQMLEYLSDRYIEDWYYMYGKRSHNYSSIENSVKVYVGNHRETKSAINIDLLLSIDKSTYIYQTSDYNIYHYSNSPYISDDEKLKLTFGNQWDNGIIGLPEPWPHLKAQSSLKSFMENNLRDQWGDKRRFMRFYNKL